MDYESLEWRKKNEGGGRSLTRLTKRLFTIFLLCGYWIASFMWWNERQRARKREEKREENLRYIHKLNRWDEWVMYACVCVRVRQWMSHCFVLHFVYVRFPIDDDQKNSKYEYECAMCVCVGYTWDSLYECTAHSLLVHFFYLLSLLLLFIMLLLLCWQFTFVCTRRCIVFRDEQQMNGIRSSPSYCTHSLILCTIRYRRYCEWVRGCGFFF